MGIIFSIFISMILAMPSFAQQSKPNALVKGNLTMERFTGAPMKISLDYGIELNKGSSLNREGFVIRDTSAPITLIGEPTPKVEFLRAKSSSTSDYFYTIYCTVNATEPIVAYQLRSIVINIFGKAIKTLEATMVRDVSDRHQDDLKWKIWSENEASEAFAFITYISKARTVSGKVYEIDQKTILELAARVGSKLTDSDLEPKREITR